MTTVFDVPAELLINTVADEFRDNLLKLVFTKKENQKTSTGGM